MLILLILFEKTLLDMTNKRHLFIQSNNIGCHTKLSVDVINNGIPTTKMLNHQ